MKKYRKKPIVIEAVQWNGRTLPDGCYKYGSTKPSWCYIDTLEGVMRVDKGDWIITGVKSEKYPCKPDIFEATYEPVE